MLASALTGSVAGIEGRIIRVEVDSAPGFPGLFMVGLPDSAVRESESRIKAAVRHSGIEFFWDRRITVNLAPAHLRKSGSAFDLAIGVALLASAGEPIPETARRLFLGELALDGSVRSVPGVLPILIAARKLGVLEAIVPDDNLAEASLVSGLKVRGARSLLGAVRESHESERDSVRPQPECSLSITRGPDLGEVVGQPLARRALEVAAAGRHNLLMIGPPGSGKTMLARRLPGILPPPSEEEALEMTAIQSAAGLVPRGLITRRPFRAPHHTASSIALVGGGAVPRPGEISLAHGGVLFLDELPEFPRATLEALRQPLEEGKLVVSRARANFEFPSRFQFIAAMNPCPCGFQGDAILPCRCTPQAIARYQSRVSGPLLDRIDMVVDVPRPEIRIPSGAHEVDASVWESSERVRSRVCRAVLFGRNRASRSPAGATAVSDLRVLDLDTDAATALEDAARLEGLSMRAVRRTAQVARTIADLAETHQVSRTAVLEALLYRPSGRGPR